MVLCDFESSFMHDDSDDPDDTPLGNCLRALVTGIFVCLIVAALTGPAIMFLVEHFKKA
jgi:hypothetical protein